MRIPFTKYGLPQVIVFPAVILTIMAAVVFSPLAGIAIFLIEAVLAVILIWILSFFRDPNRISPDDTNLLLAPADGTVIDIETLDNNDFINGKALKIGIFLSIFNAHINRCPCNATVEKITYKKGRFKNARHPQAGKVNESNDVAMIRTDNPTDKFLVRQISGAVARRIVCQVNTGEKLSGGQKFGMIKFGSRTELYIPARDNVKCLVRKGDKVKAGLTALFRYEI